MGSPNTITDKAEPALKYFQNSTFMSSLSSDATPSTLRNSTVEAFYFGESKIKEDKRHKQKSSQSSGAKPKKSFKCPYCPKIFNRPSALQTHTYTHTAEKPFQCLNPNCGRSFSVVSNLRRHFKVHQKNTNPKKLCSNERLRCVKRLMQETDSLMVGMKHQYGSEMTYQQSLSHGRVEQQTFPQKNQLYPKSYPHYENLMTLNEYPSKNQDFEIILSFQKQEDQYNNNQFYMENNSMLGNSLLQTPHSWPYIPNIHPDLNPILPYPITSHPQFNVQLPVMSYSSEQGSSSPKNGYSIYGSNRI